LEAYVYYYCTKASSKKSSPCVYSYKEERENLFITVHNL
jgi:hypothetical protein